MLIIPFRVISTSLQAKTKTDRGVHDKLNSEVTSLELECKKAGVCVGDLVVFTVGTECCDSRTNTSKALLVVVHDIL